MDNLKIIFEDKEGNRTYVDFDDFEKFNEMMMREDVHLVFE